MKKPKVGQWIYLYYSDGSGDAIINVGREPKPVNERTFGNYSKNYYLYGRWMNVISKVWYKEGGPLFAYDKAIIFDSYEDLLMVMNI